jgi:hypothetical protein
VEKAIYGFYYICMYIPVCKCLRWWECTLLWMFLSRNVRRGKISQLLQHQIPPPGSRCFAQAFWVLVRATSTRGDYLVLTREVQTNTKLEREKEKEGRPRRTAFTRDLRTTMRKNLFWMWIPHEDDYLSRPISTLRWTDNCNKQKKYLDWMLDHFLIRTM